MRDSTTPLIVFLFMPLSWIFTIALIAALSGWRSLAERYPQKTEARGEQFSLQSLSFGPLGRSNNCINVWVGDSGVWLSPFVLVRPFHARIEIPWAELTNCRERQRLSRTGAELTTASGTTFTVWGRAGKALLDAQRRRG